MIYLIQKKNEIGIYGGKTMKRIISLTLSVVMILTFAACSSKTKDIEGTITGYVQVGLYNQSERKTDTKYIHRLVAEAFIPNPNNFP